MTRLALVPLALIALLTPTAAAPTPEPALPAGGLVFRVYRGGLAGELAPEVEIFADGSVHVNGKPMKARLPKTELEALLRFVVTEKDFFGYDARAVARRVEGPMCGTGATTTGVTVVTAARKGSQRQLMLETYAVMYADLPSLAHLRDIADRLRFEGRLAEAGGRARVEGWLKRANARLKKRQPKEAPLTIDTFEGVSVVPKGEIALRPQDDPAMADVHGPCATFVRRQQNPWCIVSVSVQTEGKAAAVHVQR